MSENSRPLPPHRLHRDELEFLISLYQDGEASPAERQIVENYLAGCADCRALFTDFLQVTSTLRSARDAQPIPVLNIQALIAAERAEITSQPPFVTQKAKPTGSKIVAMPARPPVKVVASTSQLLSQTVVRWSGVAAAVLVTFSLFWLVAANRQPNTNPVAGSNPVNSGVNPPVSMSTTTPTEEIAPSPSPEALPFTPAPPTNPDGSSGTAASATTTNPFIPQPGIFPPQLPVSSPTVVPTQPNTPNLAINVTTLAPAQKTVAPVTTVRPATSAAVVSATSLPASVAPRTTVAIPPNIPPTTSAPATVTVTTVATPTTTLTEGGATVSPVASTAPAATSTAVPATSTVAAVTSPPTATATPVASNAPGWIAFVGKTDGQIRLAITDGGESIQLTTGSDITWEQLSWSNDGRYLAAVGLAAGKTERSIYLLDPVSPGSFEMLTEGINPVWAPDNHALAYLASPIGSRAGVRVGRPALFDLRTRASQILATTLEPLAPQWFADSARLLIAQDRVYELSTNQIATFKLPYINDCLGAALSPTGDKLAYLDKVDTHYEMVIYDFRTARIEAQNLLIRTNPPVQGKIGITCGTARLKWTLDSKSVYYPVAAGSTPYTCLVQAVTGAARCLGDIFDPSFTADGTSLADYNSAGMVYTTASNALRRPDNPRWIAESRVPPVWQPRY